MKKEILEIIVASKTKKADKLLLLLQNVAKLEIMEIINKEKEKWSGVNMVVGSSEVLRALENISKQIKNN